MSGNHPNDDENTFQFYCACGAMMEGSCPPQYEKKMEDLWDMTHNDEECEPCTREEAIEAIEAQGDEVITEDFGLTCSAFSTTHE